MQTKLFAIISGCLLFVACGQESQSPKSAQNTIEASLPHAALVRVPVNAAGEESFDKAELRLQHDAVAGASEVVSSFENAESVAEVKSGATELDQDTSTQAWFYRGYYGRGYYGRGHGYGYGYRYYPSYNYGGRYYNYGWGNGYGYGYGYRPYYHGGYNYYYYPRWGWGSGC